MVNAEGKVNFLLDSSTLRDAKDITESPIHHRDASLALLA
jgi:hypothetical protein